MGNKKGLKVNFVCGLFYGHLYSFILLLCMDLGLKYIDISVKNYESLQKLEKTSFQTNRQGRLRILGLFPAFKCWVWSMLGGEARNAFVAYEYLYICHIW